jgi:hypothetical protein
MDYNEFNNKILDYYISRSSSTFCNLSMDWAELERIIPVAHIKLFDELKFCWNNLLEEIENIPQYFGLIAVQCFAASQMHRDEMNAEDAYKIRLKQVLGLSGNYDLHALFHGDDPGIAVQEEIWHRAKTYFLENLGQHIHIPAKTKRAGRFVQYPKSQVLLTLEDLKHFTTFFSEEFTVNEAIPFPYFEKRLLSCLKNIHQSPRIRSLFDDDTKIENCVQQVYDFFNNWNGEVYSYKGSSVSSAQIKKTENVSQHLKLLLVFENNDPCFFLINENLEIISGVEAAGILAGEVIPYPYNGLMLFNELDYENEFISSRFLFSDSNNYILVNAQSNPAEYRFLEANNIQKLSITPGICLFQYSFDQNAKHSVLSKYTQAKNPVSLIGGLKLNRRREYLVGYGPSIQCSSSHIVIHQNSRFNYDAVTAGAGSYKIRIDNCRDLEFELIEKKELMETIPSQNIGWNLSSFTIEEAFQMEGCYIICHNENDTRTWINLNLQKKKTRYRGTNLLLKAINQATI